MVIVINGPVASGKSTVARALAREVERRGRTAAAIDLDLLYEMLEHNGARKDDDRKWHRARLAAAALAASLAADGVDVVIVEGDFPAASRSAFVAALGLAVALGRPVAPRFVTLWASLEEAAVRVERDSTRTFSRDPAFLRQHYDEAERDRPSLPRTDLFLDTGSVSSDQAAATIADWALDEQS